MKTDRFNIQFVLTVSMFCILAFFKMEPRAAAENTVKNSLDMEFILIPAGGFVMGSPEAEAFREASEAQHRVTLSRPFYLQSTEVTMGQWRKIMGGSIFKRWKTADDIPVTKVSWHDANEFIDKLNAGGQGKYRLPTEAEWEYASRAGTTTAYSWGDSIDCSKAMYGNNSVKLDECVDHAVSKGLKADKPAPVKSYPPNPWGLYDMNGNVWEWCEDVFESYDPNPATDPLITGPGSMQVRRGGSFFKHGYSCRSANRAYGHPASRMKTTGFRLVFEPK